jgi:hypothetical protein
MTAVTEACTAGHFCPEATTSVTEFPCHPGTYSDATTLSYYDQCTTCEPGSSCAAGSISSAKVACTAGHYCPKRTMYPTEYPCPAGTYTAAADKI